jgi:hypothetical protein
MDISLLLRTASRREALKNLGVGILGVTALGVRRGEAQIPINSTETTSPFPDIGVFPKGDLDIIDFALNLEYLEANFYSYATTGMGIEAQGVEVTGRGTQGTVIVPSNPMVTFSNADTQQYAEEITADEIAHVKFLRGLCLASGKTPIAQPKIDLVSSFAALGSDAGLGSGFSPFTSSTNDLDFLLGAYIFEDVGVTAYHGALASFYNPNIRRYAAGIMGTEGYHAANIRSQLYDLGSTAQTDSQSIANVVNSVGGAGIAQGVTAGGLSNIVPADSNAVVYTRTTQQVLNIVYISANATPGGFFPSGINA